MLKYSVRVKTNTSQEKIIESGDGLIVYLRAKPHDGEANEALLKVLAKYFKAPKTTIKIVGGLHARNKIIEIGD